MFFSSARDSINEIKESFSKESLLGSFLFFLVLSSWYVLRPVRNEMAVANVDDLPYLLAAGAVAMLLINPIYSWVVSKTNLRKIVIYCYSFLIVNLLIFLSTWKFLGIGDSVWVGRIFYVWCNVYSFFVVSIFWVVIINIFRNSKTRSFYGVIMAGGSLGAIFGSEISKRFSNSFDEYGLEFFTLSAAILLFFAMLLAMNITRSKMNEKILDKNSVGGGSLDSIKNSIQSEEIRNIAAYVWMWTCLMTIQWITAINIIEEWSSDSQQRISFFATIEQIVSPLTLLIQLFLTNIIIRKVGIKNIMILYGFLFLIAYLLYGFFPSIVAVAIVTVFLRVFEYGFNKPTREIIYSTLKQNDRYKSSVLIDTFVSRFGDLTGSALIKLAGFTTITFNSLPLMALPIAGYLSFLGMRISKENKIRDL
ncbi:MAG: putative membrane protein [SAR86 cluster bacterium SAR86A]|jgi:AAA family ATP:ADP antiporter|uniref:Putative membrane protein n=1 Tax=SAR86 cluster bacterium SAR86A TaxID=1123866 RepID=J5K792_9GAMM|nr:MAG: putative membrane protein [SAR86 cluster bacterium SAR86A]|tara:strand:- start:4738 stop:6000 length:1263 start_codon:yes stop_codon:yes gene_type:complete